MTTPRRGGSSDGRSGGRGQRGRPSGGSSGGRSGGSGGSGASRQGRGAGAGQSRSGRSFGSGSAGSAGGSSGARGRGHGSSGARKPDDRAGRRDQGAGAQGDRRARGDGAPTGRGGQSRDWRDRRPSTERRPNEGTGGSSAGRDDRRGRPATPESRGSWRDRRPSGDRRGRPAAARGEGARVHGDTPPASTGPEIPDWASAADLDRGVRAALRGLDPRSADRVARHLVAAGTLLDEDPGQALAHARAARDRASRIAAVREAVGVAAYHAGDYAEAARELRAYRRLSGDAGYRAVLADCERAMGRPEVALRLVAEALADAPDADETAELRLVEAGAREDLGEVAAARLVLEGALGGRPTPDSLGRAGTSRLRLASAYADLLRAQGEDERSDEWLAAIAAADPDDEIGALERLGVEFADEDGDGDVDGDHSAEAAADVVPSAGRDFDAEVEAEVAELLGETGAPSAEGEAGTEG